MNTLTVTVDDAQTQLRALLARALGGDEVIIADDDKPVARLVSVTDANDAATSLPNQKRVFGLHRGQIEISADFDEPLPDEFWLGEE